MPSRWFRKKCTVLPDFFHEGKTKVDSFLLSLEACTAVVTSLCIYKTPLQQGPLQTRVPLLPTIFHHFLMVDVSAVLLPGEKKLNGLQIRAEKLGRDENGQNTGITVRHVPFVEERDAEKHYKVDDLHVRISMRQLLDILKTHCPDYDLVRDNCWKYADATCRALLGAFRDLRPERDEGLTTHLEQMPTLVMPLQSKPVQVAGYAIAAVAAGATTMFIFRGLSAFFGREEEEEEEELSSALAV